MTCLSSALPTTSRSGSQTTTHNPLVPDSLTCTVPYFYTTCTNWMFSPHNPVLQRETHWAVLSCVLPLNGIWILTLSTSLMDIFPSEASKGAISSPEDLPHALSFQSSVCRCLYYNIPNLESGASCMVNYIFLMTSLYVKLSISFLFAAGSAHMN